MSFGRTVLIAALGILTLVPPALLVFGINPPSTGAKRIGAFAGEGLLSTEWGRWAMAAMWLFLFGLLAASILKRQKKPPTE